MIFWPRFMDHDMFMHFRGGGIGHKATRGRMQALHHSLAATEEEIDENVVDKPLEGDKDKESEEDNSDSDKDTILRRNQMKTKIIWTWRMVKRVMRMSMTH